MSGRRTKQLRRECAVLLGRSPRKAAGHVTMRSIVTRKEHRGRTIVQRLWGLLKPADGVQIDEFRFFKRRHTTPGEEMLDRQLFLSARRRHQEEVDRNNEHMADLRRQRAAEVAA